MKHCVHPVKFASPPPSLCLDYFQCHDPESVPVSEQSKGFLHLGLPEMALECLNVQTAGGIHPDPDLEALRLLALEQAQMPSSELGRLCLLSLSEHGFVFRIAELAAIHLISSRQYAAALHLLAKFQHHPEMQSPEMWHNHACACAQLRFYEQALESVVKSVSGYSRPSALLMDAQILPLWFHYADNLPTPHEAGLILSPAIAAILRHAESGSIQDAVCGFEMERTLPRSFVPHVTRDLSSSYRMTPDTPAAVRHRFRLWRDNCRRRNLRLMRRAIHNARIALKPPVEALATPASTHDLDADTLKSRATMDALRAALDAETDPEVRAEIQEKMNSVALSWFIHKTLADD